MPSFPLYTLDAFTTARFAGNPAGVVFQDGSLTPAQMQTIAGELHLETAFLSPPPSPEADFAVCYYTGTAGVPFCGHDTVAAARALVHRGDLSAPGPVRFATDVGILTVEVADTGDVTLNQSLPTFGPLLDAAPLADALGIPLSALSPSPIQSVSTGTPFAFLGVRSADMLHGLHPDMTRLAAHLVALPVAPAGCYVWTPAVPPSPVQFHARCFCPGLGLPEDPVTGSASGAFGAYLVQHGWPLEGAGDYREFRTEQGRAMGRVGTATIRLGTANGRVSQVQVSGPAVLVSEGMLYV